MLVLTSPTSGGRSVDIVRSRTEVTEFVCLFTYPKLLSLSLHHLTNKWVIYQYDELIFILGHNSSCNILETCFAMCTVCFNLLHFYILLHSVFVRMFHMFLTTNSDVFPKQQQLVRFYSREVICFLWGTNSINKCIIFKLSQCGGWLENLHGSPSSRKRWQKENPVVSNETVRCGHEFCGTWTGEWQRILRVNYGPVLSSRREPHNMETADVRQ
jgi:hypothetical protein